MSNRSEEEIDSPSTDNNSRQGTMLLYAITTVFLGVCVGAALDTFGRLPSYIVTMVTIIWGAIGALVVAIIVNLISNNAMWRKVSQAKPLIAIPSSIVTIALLGGFVLLLPPSITPSRGSLPTATVTTLTNTISPADATASVAAANPDNYPPTGGTLTLSDTLQQSGEWSSISFPSTGGKCQFADGSYQVIETNPQYFAYCPGKTSYTNFAFEVQMIISQGECGGIVFRAAGIAGNSYLFQVCQDETYSLSVISNNGIEKTLIPSNKSVAINKGLNQLNTIAVVADGTTLTLYVNYHNLGSVIDTTYSGGQVGFVAYPGTQPTEVIYKAARLWNL